MNCTNNVVASTNKLIIICAWEAGWIRKGGKEGEGGRKISTKPKSIITAAKKPDSEQPSTKANGFTNEALRQTIKTCMW